MGSNSMQLSVQLHTLPSTSPAHIYLPTDTHHCQRISESVKELPVGCTFAPSRLRRRRTVGAKHRCPKKATPKSMVAAIPTEIPPVRAMAVCAMKGRGGMFGGEGAYTTSRVDVISGSLQAVTFLPSADCSAGTIAVCISSVNNSSIVSLVVRKLTSMIKVVEFPLQLDVSSGADRRLDWYCCCSCRRRRAAGTAVALTTTSPDDSPRIPRT